MHKMSAKFENKIGERTYQFFCDVDAPLGEVFDSLVKFKVYVTDMIQRHAEAEKKSEEAKAQAQSEGAQQ